VTGDLGSSGTFGFPGDHVTSDKIRLLMVSGAVGVERDGKVYISDEQARKLEALPRFFDVTLVVKERGPRADLTYELPTGIEPAWISTYTSKWGILAPRRFLSLRKVVKENEAFLSFMPMIDGIAPLVLALLARRKRYILLIATPIHFKHIATGGRFIRTALTVLVNICALMATRVLANGSALKEDLIPPLRRRTKEVVVSSISEADFMAPRDPHPGEVRLLCVSRLVPSKRVDVVIRTTRLLAEQGIDVHLDVVGDGPLKGGLVRQVDSLNLNDRVRFTGWVGDRAALRDLYRAATFFVFATETEGISLSVQEAMASGVPVISTAPGGLKAFLRDGEDAVVIDAPDPALFVEAILELVKDPARYALLAKTAQSKVSGLSNETWVREFGSVVTNDLKRV
jgi:glycosyltransferase involved in cell wall biosynthesis